MTSLPIANIDQLVNYVAVKKRNGPSFQQQQQQSTNNKKKTTNKINCSKYNNNDTDITFSPICSNDNEIHTVFSDSSGGDGKESGLSQQQQHLDPNTLMEKGLSWLLKGAEMKIADLQEFQIYQSTQSDKYDAFSSLCDFQKTQSVIGNTIHEATERQRLDTIIQSIDLRKKCAIIFDEEKCKTFVKKNKKIILVTAYHMFNKKTPTKLRGYNVKIKKLNEKEENDDGQRRSSSGVNVSRKKKERLEIILEQQQQPHHHQHNNKLSSKFRIDDIKIGDLVTNFDKGNNKTIHNKRIQKEILQDETLPPEKRQRLDPSVAEHSLVFSQLRRMDHNRPLYLKNKTLWQYDDDSGRLVEVIGWYEPKSIPGFNTVVDETTDMFYMPHSFQNMAFLLMKFFKGYLAQQYVSTRKNKKFSNSTRLLIPREDMPGEYAKLTATLDKCLMVLLSIHTEALSDSSTEIYRQKFRRYCIYSFCMYLINEPLHARCVSPLPYNYFNLYSYLFAHGPKLKTTSFLNTMCFLNNNLFKLYRGPATESVQRLVDSDYSLLKGGKSVTHTFGSPSKTSIHTRTLVSFMMYSEYMMRVLYRLLETIERSGQIEKYKSIRDKARQNLSRLCEGVLFIFFSFVFFHRISAIRQLTNWSALRLILGQPHIHDSKSKAKSVTSIHNNDNDKNNQFVFTEKATNSSGLFFSHAHVLGLPYGIQKRLGVPLEKLNPLCQSSRSLGIVSKSKNGDCIIYSKNDNNNNNNNNAIICGIDLPLPPPPPDGYCSKLVMFDNVFSEQLSEYYNDKTLIPDLVMTVACKMNYNLWTDMSLIDKNQVKMMMKKDRVYTEPLITPPPFSSLASSSSDQEQYRLTKDTLDYLMASPLKNVFIVSSSEQRILSLGDLALLALWIKVSVLQEAWENETTASPPLSLIATNDRAVTVSESWLSGLCRQLIRTDLVNFGIWGDVKINLKLDKRDNSLHKNNMSLPKERDKLRYTQATLNQRKDLAELHCKKNIKTKTHLGRVTATSWVVCALKKISGGDPNIFLKLLENVGIYHLSHINPSNTYAYFSNNCLSNEDQMGLDGYTNRMKNTDGQQQLVLHDGAKKELARTAFRSTNNQNIKKTKEKINTAMIKMAIKHWVTIKDHRNNNDDDFDHYHSSSFQSHSIEALWRWPHTLQKCLAGKRVSLVCKQTQFLNYCLSDSLVSYNYNDPTSSFHLMFKITDNKDDERKKFHQEDSLGKIGTCNSKTDIPIENFRDKLSSSAVITTSKNIYKFDKLKLAKSQKDRERIQKYNAFCKIASQLKKISSEKSNDDINSSLFGRESEILSRIEPKLLSISKN